MLMRCTHTVGETLICAECNANIEAKQPWLSERQRLDDKVAHSWVHALVSLPASPSVKEPVLSIDERFEALAAANAQALAAANAQAQARFDEFANETHARMARLEALLMSQGRNVQ
jgi:hypothetical protein